MSSDKARVDAIQQAARALIEARGIDITKPWPQPLRIYAAELAAQAGCHTETAKRHLAKAARLMRGEAAKPRGGRREGAGRPPLPPDDPRQWERDADGRLRRTTDDLAND